MKLKKPIDLIYIGDGSWLPGVPARDLTADEVERSGYTVEALLESGLYKIKEVNDGGDQSPT